MLANDANGFLYVSTLQFLQAAD